MIFWLNVMDEQVSDFKTGPSFTVAGLNILDLNNE